MPPTRRKSSQPNQAQKTLAFGPNTNKITKPTLNPPTTLKKPSLAKAVLTELSTPSPPPEKQSSEAAPLPTPSENLAIREPKRPKRSPIEEKAEKVPEADVRKYWRIAEEQRKTKRVHQTDLPIHEKILRHFDLSSQYGPCIGITRLKRWKRASTLNLNPPIEVLAVLMREEAKGDNAAQMAYVDELLNTRSEL